MNTSLQLHGGLIAVLSVVFLALSGCDLQRSIQPSVPKEEKSFARTVLKNLEARDFESIEAVFDPDSKGSDFKTQLEDVAGLFPEGEPAGPPAMVGFQWNRHGDVTHYALAFEYEYPQSWLVGNVMFRTEPSGRMATGIFIEPTETSLAEAHRFSFEGKSAVHLLILGLVVAIPLFILYTLVRVLRTPMPGHRRLLWALFVLIGFVQINLNWSTGGMHVTPLSFQILGAGFFTGGPYGPWTFIVSIPVGAILFMLKRRKNTDGQTGESARDEKAGTRE